MSKGFGGASGQQLLPEVGSLGGVGGFQKIGNPHHDPGCSIGIPESVDSIDNVSAPSASPIDQSR